MPVPTKQAYLDYIHAAGENVKNYLERSIQQWRQSFNPDNPLFGYAASGAPAAAAAISAFLYEQTGELGHARQAREALLLPRELTEHFPAEVAARHPEYHQAVPPMDGLFVPPNYIPAYERVRHSDVFDPDDHAAVASIVADSLHTLFHFPEWGAHNRAMLRALSLALAARAFPDHREAARWHELAVQLASDSEGHWSIEDAMGYHAVWMLALFSYAEVMEKPEIYDLPVTRYYVAYFARMLTPLDTFPDFGDCNWGGGAERLLPCFEKTATRHRDSAIKYVADSMARRIMDAGPPSIGNALLFMQAYTWADDNVEAVQPDWGSGDLLDDLVGKKVLFRTGWNPDATYLLLNYRDELGYGAMPRRYLRTTLAVSAEKMHHGHADENSIVLLMDKGTVLLHDGGYRENVPNGQYRADIYHNRVIWRPGIKRAATSAWDFLHDDGRYTVTRTEKLHGAYFDGTADFPGPELSRTRVTDEHRNVTWERVVVHVRSLGCFILIDAVRALAEGPFTLANVLYTSEIVERGPYPPAGPEALPVHFDTHITTIGMPNGTEWRNPGRRHLLIAYPLHKNRPIQVEAVRRTYHQEAGLFQVWTGWLAPGAIVPFATVLWPHDPDQRAAPLAQSITMPQVSQPGRAIAVRLATPQRTVTFGCKLDLTLGLLQQDIRPRYNYVTGAVRYGDVETDATHVYLEVDSEESRAYAAFVEGTRLIYRDTPSMECSQTELRETGHVLYEAEHHRMFQEDATNRYTTPSWREMWQATFNLATDRKEV
jgi:hypothetical protein